MTYEASLPPGKGEIEAMARIALSKLPEPFSHHCEGLVLRVEEIASVEMLGDLGQEDPMTLTGLYDGIALTQKSTNDLFEAPDTVWLFRRPILAEWIERGDVSLSDLIEHILIHEIAHHFGWSDDDIAAIDRWWE